MTAQRLARLGRWMCLGGASFGVLGLFGWLAGATLLTSIIPGQPPMMPNTAVALMLVGIAGALRKTTHASRIARVVASLAAIVVLAIGVGTIAEYALGVGFGFDQLLIPIDRDVGPYPGRPSPPTALAITCVAVALLIFDRRPTARMRLSEWLIFVAGLSGFTALLGQLFGAESLYRLTSAPVIGVALPTALSLLLTSAGMLLERSQAGIMGAATSPGPGGGLLRQLTLVMFLGPAVLGLVVSYLFSILDVDDFPLVVATLAAAMTVSGMLLLIRMAYALNRSNEALESNRRRTLDLVEQAPDGIFVADSTGRYLDVNAAGCRMLGYSREELVGKTIVDLIPPGEVERLWQSREQMASGAIHVGEWTLRHKDGTHVPVEVSARVLADGRWQGFVRDVSERKQVEARLRQSQERFELALKGADLATWDWNIATGEVSFNSRWAEMRGFRPDELAPHVDSWRTGIHPDDWPEVERVLTEHLQGKSPEYEAEHRVRTKRGEWIWLLDRGRVFARDDEGRPTRMVGTELDITHRKRADEALRLLEARSTGILSISADAIISIDEDHRITMFNKSAEKIFGYSTEEAIGAPLDILLPERLQGSHRREVEQFAAGREAARRMGERHRPLVGRRKSGEEFPIDAAISRLEVGGKRILTVSLRDITEQQRTEREQRFLAEVGPMLVATLDYEQTLTRVAQLVVRDLADLCIVDLVEDDGAIRRLEAVVRDPTKAWVCDLLAHLPLDRQRPHLVRSVLETMQPVLLQQVSPEQLASLAQSEEHLRALTAADLRSIIAVPLVAQGKLLGAIALGAATSSPPYGPADLQLAEELGRRAALAVANARLYRTAQRAIQARDEVLGVVAHDLRNPLNTIVLQTTMLEDAGPGARRAADAIERAARRMDHLIQDLLDVTQLEAGRLSIEPARVSAAQLVSEAVEAQQPLAGASSIELRIDLPRGVPEVSADRDRLFQVFENLISNALKFTERGGTISVGAAVRDGDVVFWVADTGHGIPPDDLPHVFDRFWQARKARHRGAGLGLPIAKGIVEAHGGRIWVESTPGRGTSFFFTIPAARVEPWRSASASAPNVT